jgi:hypothetical protein
MTSVAAAGVEKDMMVHSSSEDSYVMAPLDSSAVESAIERDSEEPRAFQIRDPVPLPPDPKWEVIPDQDGQRWKMTEELFQAAKDADAGTPGSYWSHSLYRGPPSEDSKEGTVKVHYCRSKLTTERVLATHFLDAKVIGFDIEWLATAGKNAGPKQKVSLIQVATAERVALFHLALYPGGNTSEDLVSPALKKLMENPEITKVGVAIKGDCTRLRNNLGIDSKGLFELSHLYKLIKFSESKEHKLINKKLVSLATQVQEHLHLPMFKGGEVRSSDWSKVLQLEQIRYAASDSYAGIQLFTMMEAKREKLDPTPPRPFHAECNIPIRIATGETLPADETAAADLEEEEELPEEPDTPAPSKRKYNKKAVPYYSPNSSDSFEFEDRALQNALEANKRSIPTTTARKRTPTRHVSVFNPDQIQEDPPTDELPSPSPLLQAAETEAQLHYHTLDRNEAKSSIDLKQNLLAYCLWSQNPSLSFHEIDKLDSGSRGTSTRLVLRRILISATFLVKNNHPVDTERIQEVLETWKDMGFPEWDMRELEPKTAASEERSTSD